MKKMIILLIVLVVFCSFLYAAELDSHDFTLEFTKSGTTEIFFSVPNTDPVQIQDSAIAFNLLGNPETDTQTKAEIGVNWQIFGIDGIAGNTTSYSAEIGVLFSEDSDFNDIRAGEERYMLRGDTPTDAQPEGQGLNYYVTSNNSADVAGSQTNKVDSSNGIVAPLSEADRTLVLFDGMINPSNGQIGNAVLTMTLNAPIVNGVPTTFTDALYRGYLILYVMAK